ncbi:MAG: haloalkane dehalogenase [Alphaproteobacteria bacterium]|nr:haloalkane dehalogenase [Alphaproteobacteria bacterium]
MAWKDDKQFVTVKGLTMAYKQMGEGAPILFLHGNPTSSYLWRDVMAPLSAGNTCIAPDLIGMGDSDKLPDPGPDSYRFVEHREYLNSILDQILPDEPVVLVIHDWGSALGFDWARRNPGRVRAIAYMESIVRPMDWDEFNQQARPVFEGFRSPAGEGMILQKNMFVERVLPGSILRDLSEDEMAEYRRPFATEGEDRRPTLTWPRQIPLGGEPEDVVGIVNEYGAWLSQSDLPKLFINAEPGAILISGQREFCRSWPNQTEVTVKGAHFIQEDSAAEIADAIGTWLDAI